jgi:hypothetical protein
MNHRSHVSISGDFTHRLRDSFPLFLGFDRLMKRTMPMPMTMTMTTLRPTRYIHGRRLRHPSTRRKGSTDGERTDGRTDGRFFCSAADIRGGIESLHALIHSSTRCATKRAAAALGSGLVDSIRASSRALIDVHRIDDDASTTRVLCVCVRRLVRSLG